LTIAVGELLEASGHRLAMRLVAGSDALDRRIAEPRIQLPGLALAGFVRHVRPERVQVFGNSEIGYLETLAPDAAGRAVDAVVDAGPACFVVTNGTDPPEWVRAAGHAGRLPVIASGLRTRDFIRMATVWLEDRLAPETTLHADLVEVLGLGILIRGRSGIGKSEAALDLVSRGHRLVADDAVMVRRIAPGVLRGRAAALVEHHMEIRGIGVIDVEALFGPLATLEERQIDLVVELCEWAEVNDRLVLEDEAFVLLDVPLPHVRIPVKPGRSVAMLIETATRDRLLRGRGRNSAVEFAARIDRAAAGFDRDLG